MANESSVLMPAYNGEKLIKEQLDSLRFQTKQIDERSTLFNVQSARWRYKDFGFYGDMMRLVDMKKIHKIKNQISVAVEKGDLDIAWEATFPNAGLRIVSDKLVAKLGGRYSTIDKIKRHHFKKLCSVTITESVFELVKEDNLNKDQYLIGVFHNSIPTQTVKSIILKEFTFPAIEGNKNLEFIKKFKTKMRLQYI